MIKGVIPEYMYIFHESVLSKQGSYSVRLTLSDWGFAASHIKEMRMSVLCAT